MEAALLHRDHAKVPLGGLKWRWSEEEKFPPVATVLRSPLWSSDKYSAIRTRLRQAVPVPTVQMGGRFVTLDLHAPTNVPPAVSDEPPTPTTGTRSVYLCGSFLWFCGAPGVVSCITRAV